MLVPALFNFRQTPVNNIIRNNTGYAISADVQSLPEMTVNTLEGNSGNGYQIRQGEMTSASPKTFHWDDTDIVYVVDGYVTVGERVTLDIAPGMIIKFAPNRLIGVKGQLLADGTADQPIIFTSLKDDAAGGDTNGDRANSVPEPGDWGSITFHDNNRHVDSVIQHAVVRYGGFHQDKGEGNGNDWYYTKPGHWDIVDFEGVIWLAGSSPTISNSTIEHNVYAMRVDENSSPSTAELKMENNVKGDTLQQ